jgi:hypothetical protein
VSLENQSIYPIVADRDYYVVRAGRALEVRSQDTHAVLQVLEPPREWGDDWLWSDCGFDGLRCVPLDCIRFVRNDPNPLVQGEARSADGGMSRPAATESRRESDAYPVLRSKSLRPRLRHVVFKTAKPEGSSGRGARLPTAETSLAVDR